MQAAASPPREQDWPLLPWLLAGLLGLAGLLIHLVTDDRGDVPWRVAIAAFLLFAPLAASLSVERDNWKAPAAFSLALGLVMAGIAWRAVRYGESLPDEEYGFAAGVVASALALPLFQAGFLKERLRTPYSAIHANVWGDAIAGAGAIAFTGLSWIVLWILSDLFLLLKIEVLRDLIEEGWFVAVFIGLAFGAALGTLRNQMKVLSTLRSVVLLVLSLIAVPLATGLAIFLLATAVSGPEVLWEATRSATPILLTCAAGAWVLANAILRDGDAEMTGNRVLRLAALVLAAVILPLAVFAAVSMGLRLAQYGLAPERIWGLVAIVVACAFGLGYWGAIARGRRAGWADRLREANVHLAAGTCVLALLLALPVLDFGALSTRNQLARLEAGKVTAEDFDYAALRWDFGEAGREALERLAEGEGKTAELAGIALKQTERPYGWAREIREEKDFDLTVQPDDPELRRLAIDYLRSNPWPCSERCLVLEVGPARDGVRDVAIIQGPGYRRVRLPLQQEGAPTPGPKPAVEEAARPAPAFGKGSKVEIRTVEKRYIFVDGKPLDRPLD